MEILSCNFAGPTRRAKLGGREHLIAPLTMISPGVLSGSMGPLLYRQPDVCGSAERWDGMPILVGHPKEGGVVSGRDPGVLDRQGVGMLFHTRCKGGKLVAEGWFDVERTKKVDPRVLKALEAGKPMELSTGLYPDLIDESGTHNGIAYTGIAVGIRPDHLAVLPDTRGACSREDGCGVMVGSLNAFDQAIIAEGLAACRELRLAAGMATANARVDLACDDPLELPTSNSDPSGVWPFSREYGDSFFPTLEQDLGPAPVIAGMPTRIEQMSEDERREREEVERELKRRLGLIANAPLDDPLPLPTTYDD